MRSFLLLHNLLTNTQGTKDTETPTLISTMGTLHLAITLEGEAEQDDTGLGEIKGKSSDNI